MVNDIGNRIFTKISRPPKDLVEKFRGIPSSNIGDVMNRLYCMREYIKPIGKANLNMLGTAFTVKVPDGDNVFIHRALDIAEPGDIIVVDGNGCITRSLIGEIMFTYAYNKGIAGIVIDGAIRDSNSLLELDLPVYAAGITPQGPYKNGAGEINVPISCGGQVVFPGDILIGDDDGICVVRVAEAEKIINIAQHKFEEEKKLLEHYHTVGNDFERHQNIYISIVDELKTFYY